MSEEEIKEILVKFAKVGYEIANIDNSKPGETTVIIRFNDVSEAGEFLTAFNESSDSTKDSIKTADFSSGVDISISGFVRPFVLFNDLLI